jgi:hypothetical protein
MHTRSASGAPVSVRVEGRRAIFEMTLFSADVITFELRATANGHPDETQPSLPPLGYVVCDIGRDTVSAISTDNHTIADFNASARDLEGHVTFLSA